MAKLVVRNLRKLFGDFEAVKDVSFEVSERETLCLLGPSGCGKTTTLRMIAGLETPTSGYIYIDDALVNDVPPQKRGIGLVFQDYAVFPHMSVFDNLAFGLKVRRTPKHELTAKVDETALLLGLSDVLHKSAKGLGLSEIQRVAIGRSIILDPKILLLDEPLSNVAAKVRERMRGELKRIQKEIGIATVYVTHDQLEAMVLGDRIAVMRSGLIEQIAKPDEIYAHPHTLFVADFIGSPSMNLVECELLDKGKRVFLDAKDFAIDFTEFAETVKRKATGPELMMGIRPEDLSINIKKIDPKAIRGEVQLIESLGSSSIYHIKVGQKPLLVKGLMEVEVGDKVWVRFDFKKLHLFDKKTEVALW